MMITLNVSECESNFIILSILVVVNLSLTAFQSNKRACTVPIIWLELTGSDERYKRILELFWKLEDLEIISKCIVELESTHAIVAISIYRRFYYFYLLSLSNNSNWIFHMCSYPTTNISVTN